MNIENLRGEGQIYNNSNSFKKYNDQKFISKNIKDLDKKFTLGLSLIVFDKKNVYMKLTEEKQKLLIEI